jgi:hypothetical protein
MEVPRTDIEVFKASDDPSLKITQCASWIWSWLLAAY